STPNWNDMLDTSIRGLNKWAPLAAEFGVGFAIENHQDLGSEELLRYAEAAGRNVGICFDTGNPLAVGEDIVAFAKRVSGRVSHVHLKDYRVQFTDEGYRLVRCPIADGCAPFKVIEGILLSHHDHLTASLEPGALEARHVRLFTDEWWNGYPPRSARELGAAMRTARRNRLAEDEEYRTPWELHATGDEIVRYEKDVLKRSVDNMKQLGWL
ncbi:MAG TPA: sugar phosphate isomerase/epimerase, partial [Fimbriimonas sp.]|nr:sugar phosphate isomerase/epimerase [Fimbriimonas sp.]